MATDAELAVAVRELAWRRAGAEPGDLGDDLPLGAGGLGLDSIALVELLLDCEQLLGAGPCTELLDGPPPTVAALVAHVQAHAAR